MDLKTIEVAVFDIDQTINASESIRWRVLNMVLKNYDIRPMTMEKYISFCPGKGLKDIIVPELFKIYPQLKHQTDRSSLYKVIFDWTNQEFEKPIRLMPHTKEALIIFEKYFGRKMGCCTGENMEAIERKLKASSVVKFFPKEFWTPRSETISKKPKPHPEMYEIACKKLKVEPEQCLVFEDSFEGVLSAKDAGCKVVGIPSRYTMKDYQKIRYKADICVAGGWTDFWKTETGHKIISKEPVFIS